MPKNKKTQPVLPREEWPYEVPKNWIWTKLGTVITLISGRDVPLKLCNSSERGIPYVMGASNIANDRFIAERWIEKPVVVSSKNDILLSVKGTIGKIYLQQEKELNISRQIMALRPNCILRSDFCKLGLLSIVPQLQQAAVGLIPGISRTVVLEKEVPLPPLPEQQRIVARIESLFAKLDAAEGRIKDALEKSERLRASVLHLAFTGELTKKWREEHGVGMDSWKQKRLNETGIEIIDGDRGTNYPKRHEFLHDGYCLFLNAKNVTKEGFLFSDLQFISKEKDDVLRAGKLQYHDIVLTTRGTIGNVAYYDKSIPYQNMRINSGMVIYRGGPEFERTFLVWFYKSDNLLGQIEKLQTGTAQQQLPIKVMKNLLLPIPTLPEQREIVRILDAVFDSQKRAKEIAEKSLSRIADMKKSLLALAFRGQLGTNDPAEESMESMLLASS